MPSPSAGRERSARLSWVGAGLVAVGVEPVESEWAESKLEASERAATVALGDGGRLLALVEPAPSCLRRHGGASPALSWPAPPELSAVSLSPPSLWPPV